MNRSSIQRISIAILSAIYTKFFNNPNISLEEIKTEILSIPDETVRKYGAYGYTLIKILKNDSQRKITYSELLEETQREFPQIGSLSLRAMSANATALVSTCSFETKNFFITSVVISKENRIPSDGFKSLIKILTNTTLNNREYQTKISEEQRKTAEFFSNIQNS
ncbi:hypothetical protein [Caminibacter pacificus]